MEPAPPVKLGKTVPFDIATGSGVPETVAFRGAETGLADIADDKEVLLATSALFSGTGVGKRRLLVLDGAQLQSCIVRVVVYVIGGIDDGEKGEEEAATGATVIAAASTAGDALKLVPVDACVSTMTAADIDPATIAAAINVAVLVTVSSQTPVEVTMAKEEEDEVIVEPRVMVVVGSTVVAGVSGRMALAPKVIVVVGPRSAATAEACACAIGAAWTDASNAAMKRVAIMSSERDRECEFGQRRVASVLLLVC